MKFSPKNAPLWTPDPGFPLILNGSGISPERINFQVNLDPQSLDLLGVPIRDSKPPNSLFARMMFGDSELDLNISPTEINGARILAMNFKIECKRLNLND